MVLFVSFQFQLGFNDQYALGKEKKNLFAYLIVLPVVRIMIVKHCVVSNVLDTVLPNVSGLHLEANRS